jgi:hypothetical protein
MGEREAGGGDGRPVFLHGAWRSGSTYYWSRFRALPETLCFYEPLHHGLAKLTPRRIAHGDDGATAALGHPKLEAPYFTEYAPLIRGRGVRHYHRALAYERFHLDPSEPHPALRRYVAGLIDHAQALGKRPVLGFNRSCGRVAWLRRRFSAYDIHIDRDPASIWASYAAEQARGNDTFFSLWLRVLEANQAHPVWAPLAERLRPRGPWLRRLTRTRTDHHARIAAMSAEDSYLLVFYAWLATAPASMAACDLVIDDGLLPVPHYARRIETEIEVRTGLRVDLSEAGVRPPRVSLDDSLRRTVEAEALALFPRAPAHRRPVLPGWTAQLCDRKAALVAALA